MKGTIVIGCVLLVLLLFALSACAPQAPEVVEDAEEQVTDEMLQEQYPSGLDEAREELDAVE